MSFKPIPLDQGGTGAENANDAKTNLSLNNVDNTSDATKNSATATLTNKTLTSPVINSPTGIVKGDIGLGNVDNTSDANKTVASSNALESATTTVDVSASTAPTVGQVLTATSPTAATWQTPSGGGGASEIFVAHGSANYNLTTTTTVVPFNVKDFDTGGNFDSTTFKYTAPSDGKYVFTVMMATFGLTAGDRTQAIFFKNGASDTTWQDASVASDHMINLTIIFDLVTNDTVEVRGRNITAARGQFALGTTTGHFMGYKLA